MDDNGDNKIVTLLHYDFVGASDEQDEEVIDGTLSAADLFAHIPRKRSRRSVPQAAAAAAKKPNNQPTDDDGDDDETESDS